jgi:RNA polymerase sigma-70 factor (ECF subfamily)
MTALPTSPREGPSRPGSDDLLDLLRLGNEQAFLTLVQRYHGSMLRVALTFVSSRAVAEEVTQEAWVGVLDGLANFEGRSSLKSWIFRILTNCAKTRGQRERRTVPLSSLGPDGEGGEPSVSAERFLDDAHSRWAGHWAVPPQQWQDGRLLAKETIDVIARAVAELPDVQRQVITLRDVEELTAEETCALLNLSEANQRVLLHRARSRVRASIESYMTSGARAS